MIAIEILHRKIREFVEDENAQQALMLFVVDIQNDVTRLENERKTLHDKLLLARVALELAAEVCHTRSVTFNAVINKL